jgi:membrane-bound lytic murein transglycosylase A
LFTGYFEPEVSGSRSPGGVFRTPMLGRPGDLVQVDLGDFVDDLKGRAIVGRLQDGKLVPYYDRAQIEAGALAKRRLELLWLADPIDAYFLQVQGSGRVDLPDGRVVRVSYAGQNGRRSVLIGKVLAERGDIPLEQISLQSIRAWLVAHPDKATEVLDQNPSYVFFREVNNLRPDEGPPGALGVPLTPGRSIAIDRGFLPMGAPVYVATTDPVSREPLQRLTVAQDVGGAIRGPVRADIFFGWGHDAEDRAGRMREHGTEYVLLPKPPPPSTPVAGL